ATAIAPAGALGGGAPAAPAETLAVTNELTAFAFSTQRAQFLFDALPLFKRLGLDTGTSTLAHGREPLLRYTLLAGGDTLPLSTIPFTATRETFSSGERIRFDATVGTGTLRIDYALSADNYTATVRVQASGLPQPAFLLTQLPTG